MNTIRTDDAAREQEFVYFGHPDMPFPVGARIPAIVAGFLGAIALTIVVFLLTQFIEAVVADPTLGFLIHVGVSAAVGPTIAVLAVRRTGSRITPKTPIRHHLANLRSESNTPRHDPAATLSVVDLPDKVWLEDKPELHAVVTTIDMPQLLDLEPRHS